MSLALSFIVAVPLLAAGPYAYIPNNGSSSVSVLDLTSNTVATTITGITGGPWAAAVNASGTRVFVTRKSANTVSVIDTSSHTVIGTVTGFSSPYSVVVNPAGTFAYVTNSDVGVNTVSVVNTATNTITGTIPVGKEPYGIAITPDGGRLFVACSNNSLTGASSVAVISTASNTVTGNITTGITNPHAVAINGTGTRAYVSNYGGAAVTVLDLTTDTILGNIPVALSPDGIAVSPLGSPVYAVGFQSPGKVAVIDAGSNTVATYFTAGAFSTGVAFHPVGGAAYVVNNGGNSVSVVSVPTSSVTGTAPVQNNPTGYGGFIVVPPRAASLSPVQRPVNGGAFTLTVNGTMFSGGSKVNWNGSPRTTTYVNPQQLTATITAGDVAVAGSFNISVDSPAPAGGLSNNLSFAVCTGPPSPGNSVRLSKSGATVRLGWIDLSGAGATGYNVKSCAGGGACLPVPLTTVTVNGYNDPVLASATSYNYAIEAYNGCTYTP